MDRRNAWVTSEATLIMAWVWNGSRYILLKRARGRVDAFILQDGVFDCVGLVLAVNITTLSSSFASLDCYDDRCEFSSFSCNNCVSVQCSIMWSG